MHVSDTWSGYIQNAQQPAAQQKPAHLSTAACLMAAQAESVTQEGSADCQGGGKGTSCTFPSLEHLTEDGLCKEATEAGRLLLKHTAVATTVTYGLFTSSRGHHQEHQHSRLHKNYSCESYLSQVSLGLSVNWAIKHTGDSDHSQRSVIGNTKQHIIKFLLFHTGH